MGISNNNDENGCTQKIEQLEVPVFRIRLLLFSSWKLQDAKDNFLFF